MKKLRFSILLCLAFMAFSCGKTTDYGNLDVRISYTVNNESLICDSMAYTNEAGNRFHVTEIQWFISNVTLKSDQGNEYILGHREVNTLFSVAQDHIFYIDTNIPESQTLEMASLPCGHYISMSFTFGLNHDDNVTGLFVNPPESNMFWPEPLGGGYHYMKLNGKYLDSDDNLVPLNIHLGIGQNETHTEFYQNFFSVELSIDLYLAANANNTINLDMNIDHWFCCPNIYDFNTFGSAIMQNQAAQNLLKENGNDVFSVTTTNPMKSFSEVGLQIMKMSAPEPQFFSWKHIKRIFSDLKNTKESV